MRTKLGWGLLMAVLICVPALAQTTETPEEMLGAALHQERVTGDLQAAIDGYRKVLATNGVSSSVAAQAQYHIGVCHEKLGNQEARTAFETVIRDYAGEVEIVRQAQARLAALGGPSIPSGISYQQINIGTEVSLQGTISSDGHYLSFVDWNTGDLAVRDLITGTNRALAKGSWTDDEWTQESAISRDGLHVAYSWWNGTRFGLRTVGLQEPALPPRVLYSSEEV